MREPVRNCPVCRLPMQTRESRGVLVEICPECTGLWLDRGEFDALIAQRLKGENVEDALDATAKDPDYCRFCHARVHDEHCPSCARALALPCPVDGAAMHVVVFEALEFDRCRRCGGLWLDGDERLALGREAKRSASDLPATVAANPATASRPQLGAARRYETFRCIECGKVTQRGRSREVGGRQVCEPCGRRLTIAEHQRELEQVAEASADALVACAACARTIPRRHCVVRSGHLICEPCVVAGADRDPRFCVDPRAIVAPLPADAWEAHDAEWSDETVSCAGCGQIVPAASTLFTLEAHYCEVCVVAGRYPGDKGVDVAALQAQAAASFAAARANLELRRAGVQRRAELREQLRHRGPFGHRMHAHLAVAEVVETVRDLFARWRLKRDS